MSNDETYSGYANRETWAFNLHWENDYALYHAVLAYARRQEGRTPQTIGRNVKDALRIACSPEGLSEDDPAGPYFLSVSPEVLRQMGAEVGSFWRVSETEVGEAVREGLANEGDDQ